MARNPGSNMKVELLYFMLYGSPNHSLQVPLTTARTIKFRETKTKQKTERLKPDPHSPLQLGTPRSKFSPSAGSAAQPSFLSPYSLQNFISAMLRELPADDILG